MMRAETIHVTDHALLRWRQRAAKTGEVNVHDIVKAVKDSRVIKKKEFLPYQMPRVDGSVYAVNGPVLFILESVTIDEYRLITVIAEGLPRVKPLPKKSPPKKKTKVAKTAKATKKKLSKKREDDHEPGPQGDWAEVRPVHVQPPFPRLPDMAPERDDGISSAVEQDSAA